MSGISRLMNPAQRVVVIFALLVALGMIMFPPWAFVFDPPAGGRLAKAERPAGYHLLFGSHVPQDQTELVRIFSQPSYIGVQYFSVQIDGARLLMQFVGLAILTGIAYLVVGKPRFP